MQINIIEWLNNTADRYPNKMALSDENNAITYGEYKQKAMAIAREIIDLGLDTQTPVVIYMEKSVEVLVSFLGVVYSRNFYSPIDVNMPASRVNKILEIFQPQIVITTKELLPRFIQYDYDTKFLIYEEIYPQKDDEKIVFAVANLALDTDLVYVLFTSGSTGVPKGVGIRQRSIIDYIDWVVDEFSIEAKDAFGNQAPFYFDNSILDIYSCLKTGASLYIIPKHMFGRPTELLQYIKDNGITTIFWVPTELIMVARMKALKKVDLSNTLKRVLFCGEVMPNKELNYWRNNLPDVVYSNLYGPTEITDACTFYTVNREFRDDESLPIGKPMKNTEILVLDDDNKLIAKNDAAKIGELCVKGTCLAVGYYKNPQKTNEAFVQNPLNDRYEEKIYRTGDLVSYNEYGELIYNGRKDFQIKHLGHRIELGEIETAVSSFDDITRNCCLYDTKHSMIVLFIVSANDITRAEIRDRLSSFIPEYMLPEKLIRLDVMPLNDNGKIDRNKLKEMI